MGCNMSPMFCGFFVCIFVNGTNLFFEVGYSNIANTMRCIGALTPRSYCYFTTP